MNTAILILGGNIENRFDYINKALDLIELQTGEIIARSSVYESEPWGFNDKINFLNQVIEIKTQLAPKSLLNILLAIETELGRERNEEGYTSRTIDIDILFYNDECIKEDLLIIPHPRLHQRIFTLQPLCEIVPDLVHPVFKKSIKNLIVECEDKSIVKKLD